MLFFILFIIINPFIIINTEVKKLKKKINLYIHFLLFFYKMYMAFHAFLYIIDDNIFVIFKINHILSVQFFYFNKTVEIQIFIGILDSLVMY